MHFKIIVGKSTGFPYVSPCYNALRLSPELMEELMKRILAFLLIASLLLLTVNLSTAQYQDTGVRAEAQNTVNYRSYPGTASDDTILGQMQVGLQYIVIGRHAQFPWLLLADSVTHPLGWVFQDIVYVTGDINNIPFVDVTVSNAVSAPTATNAAVQVTPVVANTVSTQVPIAVSSPTPNFNVAGTTQGEINLRYGPGTDYPRVGVAQAGDRFQVTGYHTQFPWVQIRYDASPTGFAWVATDLLAIEGDIYSTERISTTLFNLPTLTPTLL